MSPPSQYIAAIGGASSSLFHHKFSPPLSLHQFLSTQIQSKPKWNLKPLIFKSQTAISVSSSSRFPCFSASLDGFQLAEDGVESSEEELSESEELDEFDGEEEEEDDEFDEVEEEEEEEEKKGRRPGLEQRRLFVGNLPFSLTSSELFEVFAEAGRVKYAQIVYDRVTDRSRGFAFVTMKSSEEAQEAIRLFDGSQIGGRTVKVNIPEVPRGGEREVMEPNIRRGYKSFVDSSYKIYAGNLSWKVTSESLGNAFSNQRGFLTAKVIYDRDTGRSRGFGFVSFESAEDVEAAIAALNGAEFEGPPLRLSVAAERITRANTQEVERNANGSAADNELLKSYSG